MRSSHHEQQEEAEIPVNHVNICQNRLLFEAIIQMTNSLGLFSMKENNTDITAQNRCSTKSTKPDSSGAVSHVII